MAGRRGGRTFLEFRTSTSRDEPTHFGPRLRTHAEPDQIVAEIEAAGGRIVERVVGRGLAPLGDEDPEICRLAVAWPTPDPLSGDAAPGDAPTHAPQPDGGP
jgi:hypothetical protein